MPLTALGDFVERVEEGSPSADRSPRIGVSAVGTRAVWRRWQAVERSLQPGRAPLCAILLVQQLYKRL